MERIEQCAGRIGGKVNTMKQWITAGGMAVALLGAPLGASAQQASCAKRDMIVERLATKYGESRQSAGLNQNNGMVEVFASDETGTWTILVTMPNGISCLMAAGKAWQGVAEAEPQRGKGV